MNAVNIFLSMLMCFDLTIRLIIALATATQHIVSKLGVVALQVQLCIAEIMEELREIFEAFVAELAERRWSAIV